MLINIWTFSIPLRESDEGAGESAGAVPGNSQDLSTSLEREVKVLQWRIMGGICGRAKGKKSCQEKRVYKALLIKACNLKEFPQSFTPRTAVEAGPKGQAPLSSSPTTFPLVLTSHEWPRTDPWVSLGLLPAPPPPPEQMPTLQPAGCREIVEVSPRGPTCPVAMVTAGVTQLHPFLATWPHPSEPGSSRLALAARTIPEEGGRRSSLALPRAPPLGGRPSSAPPQLAALTDTERSGLQPQPGPQQPPRPAPFLEGRAALGGGTGTWGRPRQVRGGRGPGKPGIWVYDVFVAAVRVVCSEHGCLCLCDFVCVALSGSAHVTMHVIARPCVCLRSCLSSWGWLVCLWPCLCVAITRGAGRRWRSVCGSPGVGGSGTWPGHTPVIPYWGYTATAQERIFPVNFEELWAD